MLTSYQKQRILFHRSKGLKPPTIARLLLKEENIRVSRILVYKFLRRYSETASIARKPGSGRPSTITQEIKQIVEAQMQEDDETSAMQLHASTFYIVRFSVVDRPLAGLSVVALIAR